MIQKVDKDFKLQCNNIMVFFYIHGSVHRNYILIRSNEMQQYAGIYLLQNHSTCFSGALPPQRGPWPRWRKGCCSDTITCIRGCSYSSEISSTRCNNCVFILRNGFTLHVSGDNLTHHQEYICCIWPQVSRLT